MSLTESISEFAASMHFGRIPEGAHERIKAGFADCIGVMLAGSVLPVTDITCRFAGAPRAGIGERFLGGLALSAPLAGLVYGTAAHAQDFDDTGLNGHPSAILVPAILAEAEGSGMDGRRMMSAYLTGFEVWAELAGRDRNQHHDKGWHPSPVFGVVAATAAVCNLRGHDAATITRALGIAASSAAGLGANFGSMTKPFQLGRAIQFALEAVRAAELGLTSCPTAMEHELGFLKAFSPKGDVDVDSPAAIGKVWQFIESGINIKLYPMCYATHRSIDAMLQLMKTHAIGAGDIAGIEIEIGQTQAAILKHHRPQTALNAKFSAEFGVAAAALFGRVGNDELTDETVNRADVQKLIAMSRITVSPERDPEYPVFSPFDVVRVTLRDGRRIQSEPVKYPRGHHRRFPTREELWEKFADGAAGRLDQAAARRLYDRVFSLETADTVETLYAAADPAGQDAVRLPLSGITVVEMGTSVAGPTASLFLGELGATVIKIESPSGDDARSWGPPFLGEAAAMFQAINRGKRSVVVDYKDDAQRDALRRLIVEKADVVVQNLRPGLVERFGIDHPSFAAERPDLIYCNLSAFGAGGPLAAMPGYDPLLQAFGGIMSVTGHEDAEPVRVGPSLLDQGAGMWAAIGILSALLQKKATGKGGRIDTSLFETALSWLGMHMAQFMASGRVPKRMGSEHGGMVPYKAYKAADGWVVIAAANDNLFRRFSEAVGHPHWPEQAEFSSNSQRITNRVELNALIADVIATRPRDYWISTLQGVQVPCAAIQTLEEVLNHPQMAATCMLQESPDGDMRLMGVPLSFDRVRPPFRTQPPRLGEHTAILDEFLES